MGFWGTFVVYHSMATLGDLLPDVTQLDDAGLCCDEVADGWRVTRVFVNLDQLPDGFVASARDATGAPVLVADVMDSDAAFVIGLGIRTPAWQTWLRLDAALGHLVMPPSPFDADGNYLGDDWADPDYELEVNLLRERLLAQAPGGNTAAAQAIAWAVESGLQPAGLDKVTTALRHTESFVEDQFFGLLGQLGLTIQ